MLSVEVIFGLNLVSKRCSESSEFLKFYLFLLNHVLVSSYEMSRFERVAVLLVPVCSMYYNFNSDWILPFPAGISEWYSAGLQAR
jgi:hypothetical protein